MRRHWRYWLLNPDALRRLMTTLAIVLFAVAAILLLGNS
jgi:hypothetical protein